MKCVLIFLALAVLSASSLPTTEEISGGGLDGVKRISKLMPPTPECLEECLLKGYGDAYMLNFNCYCGGGLGVRRISKPMPPTPACLEGCLKKGFRDAYMLNFNCYCGEVLLADNKLLRP